MILSHVLSGATVSLRSVIEDDARFILDIRNDPLITEYLPPLSVTETRQMAWIREQRDDANSYYFAIIDKAGNPIGTISLYDVEDRHGETGRFCSYGSFVQNTEAVVLFYDFIFEELGFEYVTTWVYRDNSSIIAMNTGTGFEWMETKIASDGREYCVGILYPENYMSKMSKIRNRFSKMKQVRQLANDEG